MISTQVSTKVVVRLRKLHQCKRAQTATNVHGESLQRVKAQGDVLDTVTGAKLDKATDVNTYVAVGHFHEPPKEEDEPESAKALRRSYRVVVDAQEGVELVVVERREHLAVELGQERRRGAPGREAPVERRRRRPAARRAGRPEPERELPRREPRAPTWPAAARPRRPRATR